MQLFIDSANPQDIFPAYETGMIDGVTTNPSLAAKAGIPYKEAVKEIIRKVNGPISLEVLSSGFHDMVQEGKQLIKYGTNVVVKIPMTVDGIQATQMLVHEGIKVNMTLVFSASQALLAAKAGATYVSPFIGRLDDISSDGLHLISEIREIFDMHDFNTKILAASIRGPQDIVDCAKLGADVATLPSNIFWMLFEHPLTTNGLKKFMEDFEKAGVEPLG